MYRSFSNRILGGVCGGLAYLPLLNAWFWRLFFMILTIVSLGTGALVYVLLWWMLPLDSPLRERRGGLLPGLLAFLFSIALIGTWFARDNLVRATGSDVYWPAALLLLAVVLFIKQILAGRRGNIALGLVALLIPVVFLLGALESLPAGLFDLAARSWPAVLLFFGLSVFLRHRLPFGSFIALFITAGLVASVATFAINSRVDEERTETEVLIDEAVSEEVNTLQVNISTLATDVRIAAQVTDTRSIRAAFVGSENSNIAHDYEEDEGGIATFTFTETSVNDFPMLASIGRGELLLELPRDIATAIAFVGQDATDDGLNFDMANLDLERLNMTVMQGNAFVNLPAYQPLSPSVQETPGEWIVQNGNLRVGVPDEVGARFVLNQNVNQQPRIGESYDDSLYALELGANQWILVSRQYETLDIQVRYVLAVPNGSVRVDTATTGE